MRARSSILGLLLALAGGRAGAGEPEPLAWRLAPSDVAVYDVVPITMKDGKDVRGTAAVRTVYGHDLRDEGQYAPVTPERADLGPLLALRLPAATDATSVEVRAVLRDAAPIAARGKVASRVQAGIVEVETEWTFASVPGERKPSGPELSKGSAHTVLAFDRARRVVTSSSVTIEYTVHAAAGKDPKPTVTSARLEATLREVRRARYEGFEANVGAAIDKGVAWLKTQETAGGSFPPLRPAEWLTGTTALGLLTLAECGVVREDPAIAKALAWLVTQGTPAKTYEQALSLLAIERVYTPPSEDDLIRSGRITRRVRALTPEQRAWCERAGTALLAGVASPGSWSYPAGPRALLQFDSSNTQYGALGLRAMSRLGLDVPDTMWFGLTRHFEVTRERKGPRGTVALVHEGETASTAAAEKVPEVNGFLYSTRDPTPFASMTCAGIACLELARHELSARASRKLTPAVEEDLRARILGGWAWLDRHWGVDRSPERPGGGWHYYFLYSLERAGIFSNVRTVGGRDWYFEGAVRILLNQSAEGSWDEPDNGKVVATCFALLFLKRATPPLTADEVK